MVSRLPTSSFVYLQGNNTESILADPQEEIREVHCKTTPSLYPVTLAPTEPINLILMPSKQIEKHKMKDCSSKN